MNFSAYLHVDIPRSGAGDFALGGKVTHSAYEPPAAVGLVSARLRAGENAAGPAALSKHASGM